MQRVTVSMRRRIARELKVDTIGHVAKRLGYRSHGRWMVKEILAGRVEEIQEGRFQDLVNSTGPTL